MKEHEREALVERAVKEAGHRHGMDPFAFGDFKGMLTVKTVDGKAVVTGISGEPVDEVVARMKGDVKYANRFGVATSTGAASLDPDLDARAKALERGNLVGKLSIARQRQERDRARAAGEPAGPQAGGDTANLPQPKSAVERYRRARSQSRSA